MIEVSLYFDTRRAKSNGKYPIRIYVKNKKGFYVSTVFDSDIENWDNGKFGKNEPNQKAKNALLMGMLNRVEKKMLEIEDDRIVISDEILKKLVSEIVSGKCEQIKTFSDFADEFISTKSNPRTIEVYKSTKSKVDRYSPKCTFDTIDRKWLYGFENWLSSGGMKINAIGIHLRNIRAVFNYCIDEGYTALYPFRKFKIKKEETRKRSLTAEQLLMLRDYRCEEYQERYRDMFMLMFYLIGINAADLFNAKLSDMVNGRLEYKRAKTGKLYSIKLEPEAMKIIERYKGKDYMLNIMDEYGNYKDFLHRMGIGLKQIGECKRVGLGGKKIITPLFPDVSSYWARHTWATIAASLDIPKETISEALGHEIGSLVTAIYINFDRNKVDDANRKVIDYLETI